MNPALEVEVRDIARNEAIALLRRHGLEARQQMLDGILPAVQEETARQVAGQIPATPFWKYARDAVAEPSELEAHRRGVCSSAQLACGGCSRPARLKAVRATRSADERKGTGASRSGDQSQN